MRDAAEFISEIQGRPWTREEHCWELVRTAAREVGNFELPAFLITTSTTPLQKLRAFRDHPERERWVQVSSPGHLDVVLMSRELVRAPVTHAGIFLDVDGGGILHVDAPHGVEFVAPFEIALRGWTAEYFRRR